MCEDFCTGIKLRSQTPSKVGIFQGRNEELKTAQPTDTQCEHKALQEGTDWSTHSVSGKVRASGKLKLTSVIL